MRYSPAGFLISEFLVCVKFQVLIFFCDCPAKAAWSCSPCQDPRGSGYSELSFCAVSDPVRSVSVVCNSENV